ncbi:MAG TPA: hypothetical protein VFE50_08860 [Cyclobacteriaceae bacterium]|nr:hypothetical protein [Cyclobacteriaceae bacterium]
MNSTFNKFLRIIIVAILLVISAAVLFGIWYKYTYSMKEAMSREINDPKLATKVLIATQGSDFKDQVVSGIIDKLSDRPIYIKVTDIKELANINPPDWTAIVIIHTWEVGRPPKPVSEFVKNTNTSDLIILATSGDGNYHIGGVDGITSASKLTDVDHCVREIMNRIEIKLAPEEISNIQ